MAEDPDKKDEEKFKFSAEGEALGYIGLDQARVQAIEHARDNTDFYGARFEGVDLVWELLSADESDDYYDIKLTFRLAGQFQGEPGVEHLIFDKMGDLRVRQILEEPSNLTTPTADVSLVEEARLSTVMANRAIYQSWLRGHEDREKRAKGRARLPWVLLAGSSVFVLGIPTLTFFIVAAAYGDIGSGILALTGTAIFLGFAALFGLFIYKAVSAAKRVRVRLEQERSAKRVELGIPEPASAGMPDF